jgi:GDP-4-dehydro-6-deoxy-D-mannose reductase
MREILTQLVAIAGLENFEVKEDAQRLRPVDAPLVVGDPTAIRTATGWQPKIPLDQTLRDTYAWCAASA